MASKFIYCMPMSTSAMLYIIVYIFEAILKETSTSKPLYGDSIPNASVADIFIL